MITYLLKSIACLLILLLAHRLLLQRETMHRFNRFFLLFSVVVSFLIPLYTIEVPEVGVATTIVEGPSQVVDEEFPSEPIIPIGKTPILNTIEEVQSEFDWNYLLISIYGLISFVFLLRFVRNIKILVNQIKRNVKINYKGQTLVLLQGDSLPYSFLNYIFVAESDFENGKFTEAVFSHERTHIEEKHSWDNLFIELLMIPLWFHPGLYWAKAAIKLNHEFIADKVALRSTSLEKYESQLLAMMLSGQKHGLVSSLNFALTKKRFEMMKRKSMNSKSWIKVLVLIPVLGVLVYIFSERVAAQADKSTSEVYYNASSEENVDFDLEFELKSNGEISLGSKKYNLKEAKELIREKKSVKADLKINLITTPDLSMGILGDFQSVLRDLDIRRIHYVSSGQNEGDSLAGEFEEIINYQAVNQGHLNGNDVVQSGEKEEYYRNASFFVEDETGNLNPKTYAELTDAEKSLLHDPLKSPKRNSPSSSEFEAWKNSDDFALWFDGKVIPNSKLEDLNISDIVFFHDSYVHKNARSERFPQEHQVNIYSEEAYERTYGSKSNFGKPFTPAHKLYIYPAARRVNAGKPWVKKEKEPVSQMINPFASYDSYIKGMNDYKANLDEGVHFVKKSEDDQNKLMSRFLDLSGKYFRLSEKEKLQAGKPKHPFAPYLKLEENGKVVYKMWENLTESEKLQFPTPHSITGRSQKLLAYDRQLNTYELNRNNGEHYINKSDWKQHLSMDQYQQVQKQYALLPLEEKKQTAAPTHPYSPYVRISKNGLDIFKLANDLTEEERNNMGC